ncbi:hypothetical protein [Burkholderia sp. SIMBA_062]|uniref:hypothetical protein n=1 Tax=Burkholderia sp. SIMBA_062 TaxID=3085803 RepID=UPI00397A3AD9
MNCFLVWRDSKIRDDRLRFVRSRQNRVRARRQHPIPASLLEPETFQIEMASYQI